MHAMSWFTLISTIATITLFAYGYFKMKFRYWGDRGIPYIQPAIPLGNLQTWKKRLHSSQLMQKFYRELKGKGPFGGIYFFTKPVVLALDLEFIKNVLIKDFSYFQDRGIYYNEKEDPLSAHLFALDGHKWRNLRSKLTPTFTSGKIKYMFSTVVQVAEELRESIDKHLNQSSVPELEMKDFLSRYTMDVIGRVAFGIECNSLASDANNSEFCRMAQRAFSVSRIKQSFIMTFKGFARFCKMRTINRDSSDFFLKIVKQTVEYRETNQIKRNDLMDLLIQLKNAGSIDADCVTGKLTINEIAAQSFVFFLAGFETSATTLTYILYELSLNTDIQDKARKEIESVLEKYNGQFTYEAIMEMQYLGQIVNEALRKHPPVSNLIRMAIKDYKVPDSSYIIRKNSLVMIPSYAIHYDSEYYPNPELFDPNRFNSDEVKNRHPCAYLAFGEGPRICIGKRFGMIQTIIGLAMLLRNFEFEICSKTVTPIEIQNMNIVLTMKGGLWVNVKKLTRT